ASVARLLAWALVYPWRAYMPSILAARWILCLWKDMAAMCFSSCAALRAVLKRSKF
ncbi:hypothetical protein IW139_005560, partial [Coemansia sp. RSA 353]